MSSPPNTSHAANVQGNHRLSYPRSHSHSSMNLNFWRSSQTSSSAHHHSSQTQPTLSPSLSHAAQFDQTTSPQPSFSLQQVHHLPQPHQAHPAHPSHPPHHLQQAHPPHTPHHGHQPGRSSVSQFPPILPPIPRVASQLDSSSSDTRQAAVHVPQGHPAQDHVTHGHQEQGQYHTSPALDNADKMLGRPPSSDLSTYPHFQSLDQSTHPHLPPSVTTASLSPVLSTQSNESPSSDATSASQPLQHPPRLTRRSMTSPDGFLTTTSPRASISPQSAQSNLSTHSGHSNLSATSPTSATLGVPYNSTMAREKPLSGNRPLPATGTVNGVPQHFSKAPEKRHDGPPPSKSRNRLNLLNPVNLLMRRRSSQAVETLSDKSSTKSLLVPPMDLPEDYDPRIKGNKVHDFSAPRPRRNLSYNDAVASPPRLDLDFDENSISLAPIQQSPPDPLSSESDHWDQQRRKSSQHTPVFTENFDEPANDRSSAAIHAETLEDSSFLARNSWQNDQLIAPPPFGRKSQQLDEQQVHNAVSPNNRSSDPTSISSVRSDVSLRDDSQGLGLTLSDQAPSSPETAPTLDSRPVSDEVHLKHQSAGSLVDLASSPPEPPFSSSPESISASTPEMSGRKSGLKHLPSSASRFSFQIASMDSMAEEKLLEDKHKQRHSAQPNTTIDISDDDEDEDDFFDEDAMYDHDEMEGLDEPEVFGGNNVFQHTHNRSNSQSALAADVAGLHFSHAHSSMPDARSPPTSPNANETPFPATPGKPKGATGQHAHSLDHNQRSPPFQLASADMPAKPTSPMSTNSFYFDDGMIDDFDQTDEGPRDKDGNVFDEDQFDDPSFLKRPEAVKVQSNQEPISPSHQLVQTSSTYNVNGYDFLMHNNQPTGFGHFTSDSPYSEQSSDKDDRGIPTETFRHDSPSHSGLNPTPQDSLSAYHNALAEATQRAAADGRFTRHTSTATSRSAYSNDEGAGPSVSFQDNPPSQYSPIHDRMISASTLTTHSTQPSYSGFDFGFQPHAGSSFPSDMQGGEFGYQFPPDDDDYDFDDADLIAAANAEALSADDSGMYSQEFGFYAKPRPGSAEGERDVNGGYFGPAGIEIQRQKSLREPNLTPITERSEFSTRNSFIAGPGGMPWSPMSHAGSAQGLPSPALSTTFSLAHQRGMSPLARTTIPENENLTLAEIRRGLHANAYAGSTGSLGSDYGPSMSSPLAEYAPAFPVPGSGYYMPVPRSGNQTFAEMGGVPMAWQRSTDSNNSHPSHPSDSHSSVPSSPAPAIRTTAPPATSPQLSQAQAFSFFDAGDDEITPGEGTFLGVDDGDGSNSVTPRKPASTPYHQEGLSSPPPSMQTYPKTPPTARKAPPAPISTTSYSSTGKPALGSPLKLEAYAPAPAWAESPSSFHDNSHSHSPLVSPKYPSAGHKRTGSGADSVTYVQEKDASTGTKRWILERRRTSEQGFPELIGREIVEGGRI